MLTLAGHLRHACTPFMVASYALDRKHAWQAQPRHRQPLSALQEAFVKPRQPECAPVPAVQPVAGSNASAADGCEAVKLPEPAAPPLELLLPASALPGTVDLAAHLTAVAAAEPDAAAQSEAAQPGAAPPPLGLLMDVSSAATTPEAPQPDPAPGGGRAPLGLLVDVSEASQAGVAGEGDQEVNSPLFRDLFGLFNTQALAEAWRGVQEATALSPPPAAAFMAEPGGHGVGPASDDAPAKTDTASGSHLAPTAPAVSREQSDAQNAAAATTVADAPSPGATGCRQSPLTAVSAADEAGLSVRLAAFSTPMKHGAAGVEPSGPVQHDINDNVAASAGTAELPPPSLQEEDGEGAGWGFQSEVLEQLLDESSH